VAVVIFLLGARKRHPPDVIQDWVTVASQLPLGVAPWDNQLSEHGGGGSVVDYTIKLQSIEQDRSNTYLMLEQIYREEHRSTADAIHIIPQKHSSITQQLETWF
jgi:hypothetical protein